MASDFSDPSDGRARQREVSWSRQRDLDDAPSRQSMRGPRSLQKEWGTLQLRLRRFLHKNLGRPWDDVYRELNATLGPSNPLHKLLRQRLPDLVAQDVVEQEGKLLRPDPQGHELRPLGAATPPQPLLYVCPTTGHLRRFVPDDTRHTIVLSEGEMLRRLGKHWYRLTLAPIAADARSPSFDVVLRCLVNRPSARLADKLTRLYGRPGVFAVSKQQVGKAELERSR